MALIANRFGFRDWQSIYRHPDNAAFRRTCPDPNLLVPGARLMIPDRPGPGPIPQRTGDMHIFTLRRSRDVLRLRLRAPDGRPRAGWNYRLRLGEDELTGVVPDSGNLEVPLPKPIQTARLAAWPADAPPPEDDDEIELRVGALHPADDPKGLQARLVNLGLLFDEPDGDLDGAATVRALRQLDDPSPSEVARRYGC